LRDALCLEGLHDLRHQSRQLALRLDRVLAPDDVVADEGEIVADEHATPKGDADGERFVMAVSQSDGVGVVAVGTTKRKHAEVARTVRSESVMLLDNFM